MMMMREMKSQVRASTSHYLPANSIRYYEAPLMMDSACADAVVGWYVCKHGIESELGTTGSTDMVHGATWIWCHTGSTLKVS